MSPQQRLMGQYSSADVMSTNFAQDYTLKLEGVESIKGGDKKFLGIGYIKALSLYEMYLCFRGF